MGIKREEIYFADFNPVQGREQSGKRPVLVFLSIDPQLTYNNGDLPLLNLSNIMFIKLKD